MKWPDDDIEASKQAILERLNRFYAGNIAITESATIPMLAPTAPPSTSPTSTSEDSNPIAAPPALVDSDAGSSSAALSRLETAYAQLSKYLAEAPEPGIADPIAWWYSKRADYGDLARMAMDYLSIPRTHSHLHFPCYLLIVYQPR